MNRQHKLVLIEFIDELEEFLAYLKNTGESLAQFLVVALQPEVTAYCKRNRIDTIDTLAFFNNSSHENALKKSEELTALMAGKLIFKPGSPVQHTLNNTFIYYCRLYMNNFIWIIEIMKGIQAVYPNSEIFIVKNPPGVKLGQSGGKPFLQKRDRFVPAIVERYCRVNRLKCHAVGVPGTAVLSNRLPCLVFMPPAALPGAKLLKKFDQNVLLKKMIRRFLLGKPGRFSREKVIFLTAPSYNLDRLGREIQGQAPGVLCVTVTLNELSFPGYLKLCLKSLPGLSAKDPKGLLSFPLALFSGTGRKRDPLQELEQLTQSYDEFLGEYGNVFTHEGCPFLEELNQKVEGDLLLHLCFLDYLAGAQQALLQHLRPSLLVSALSVGPDQGWAELAGKLKIPSLVIPQKGLVAPAGDYARIEEHYIGKAQVSDDFGYAAAQTPLVKEYLTWSGYKGTVLETGNLIFAKPGTGTRQEKKSSRIIVYAPSMKSRKSRRFFVLETLDELISSIADLIEVTSRMEQVHLVIRVHPGEPITRNEIETLLPLPSHVSISDSGTLEQLLAQAAAVVSFSSTSIQEALLNQVPVVLYDKWKRYNHLQAAAFSGTPAEKASAAYYVHDKGILGACIGWVLEKLEKGEITTEAFREYIFPEARQETFMTFVNGVLGKNKRAG